MHQWGLVPQTAVRPLLMIPPRYAAHADRPKFRLPDGTEIPLRMTFVFVREEGEWKVAQQHISIGVPNEQIVGQELTVA